MMDVKVRENRTELFFNFTENGEKKAFLYFVDGHCCGNSRYRPVDKDTSKDNNDYWRANTHSRLVLYLLYRE